MSYQQIDINKIKQLAINEDQTLALEHLSNFLKSNGKYFGLYGYAGTGKTTLISKLINYLSESNILTRFNITAPTNKAVNVLQNKLNNNNMIYCSTQKLLNYYCKFNEDGERIFEVGRQNNDIKYELIIIDECSMVSQLMLFQIFNKFKK